ncbi:MAG: hypothetical protein U9Q37_02405 [Euryarchaeota archaeon]|nr:hypothetical protein [Euryarchaeota archaeon]
MSEKENSQRGILICLAIIALSLIIIALNIPQLSVNIPPQVPSGDEVIQLGSNRIAIIMTNTNSGLYGMILVFDYDDKNGTFNLVGKFDYSDYIRNPQKYDIIPLQSKINISSEHKP